MSNYRVRKKRPRIGKSDELQKALTFDRNIYDDNAGWIYSKLMSVTIWGLILSALALGLLRSSIIDVTAWPAAGRILFYIVLILFGIPSVFIFPTAFFLTQGKVRLYKESFIEIYRDKLIYQKVPRITLNTVSYEPMIVTNIHDVEAGRSAYTITGDVLNGNTGRKADSIKIPNAFESMEEIEKLARFRK